mmetsp:Transcript_24106/g.60361  ORF Transcript_24106/g.60361 Transcript_24106/m.60361 type:complete len:499 (+) Transcript_24106:111-1607(+)
MGINGGTAAPPPVKYPPPTLEVLKMACALLRRIRPSLTTCILIVAAFTTGLTLYFALPWAFHGGSWVTYTVQTNGPITIWSYRQNITYYTNGYAQEAPLPPEAYRPDSFDQEDSFDDGDFGDQDDSFDEGSFEKRDGMGHWRHASPPPPVHWRPSPLASAPVAEASVSPWIQASQLPTPALGLPTPSPWIEASASVPSTWIEASASVTPAPSPWIEASSSVTPARSPWTASVTPETSPWTASVTPAFASPLIEVSLSPTPLQGVECRWSHECGPAFYCDGRRCVPELPSPSPTPFVCTASQIPEGKIFQVDAPFFHDGFTIYPDNIYLRYTAEANLIALEVLQAVALCAGVVALCLAILLMLARMPLIAASLLFLGTVAFGAIVVLVMAAPFTDGFTLSTRIHRIIMDPQFDSNTCMQLSSSDNWYSSRPTVVSVDDSDGLEMDILAVTPMRQVLAMASIAGIGSMVGLMLCVMAACRQRSAAQQQQQVYTPLSPASV